jgi:ketosteroid isomerase-like protein
MSGPPKLSVEAVVAGAQAAWTARDIDLTLSYLAEDVDFTIHLPEEVDFSGRCRGHDENRKMMHAILDKFHFLSRVIERIAVDGNQARVTIYYHYMHKTSREIVHGRYRQVWTVQDGKAVHVDEFHDAPYFTAFLRIAELIAAK